MEIDNSAKNEFQTCPLLLYQGRFAEGTGLELKPEPNKIGPYDRGSRIHELLEEYYKEMKGAPIELYPASENEALEIEAQMIYAQYKAKYPQEDFEIVDVERTFKIQLPFYCPHCYGQDFGGPEFYTDGPADENWGKWCLHCKRWVLCGSHILTGKIDLTFRQDSKLNIMDHKSERRYSSSNHPKKWAARDQASLYLWAAAVIYKEEIGNFYVNVLTRPSEKLQKGPLFPERQRLERTKDQIEIAVRDLVIEADNIERYKNIFKDGLWPSNKEACTEGNWGDCAFYLPCTYGWSAEIREQKYQPRTEYLNLGGVPIIQP